MDEPRHCRAAPLVVVSPAQISFQVPYETTPGVATLRVTNSGSQSNAYELVVAACAPGIFQDATGHGIIQNQDHSINTAANPAAGDRTPSCTSLDLVSPAFPSPAARK